MLNLNTNESVFKPGVHVGVTEGDTIYKAKILSVDWPNTQVSVHFLNFNKRYDREINMSEISVWKTDPTKPNEFQRPVEVESLEQDNNVASTLVTSTPSSTRPGLGKSEQSTVRDNASRHGDSIAYDVGEGNLVNCSTCGCRMNSSYSLPCDMCGKKFYAETLCAGISSMSIDCILSEGGKALRYFCCSWRMLDGSDIDKKNDFKSVSSSSSQVLEMTGALAGQVRKFNR